MTSQFPCRILVLDDQPEHGEAIRQCLLSISQEHWASAGAPAGWELGERDIETRQSSGDLVASLQKRQECPFDVIICDVNMDQGKREGALAVLDALHQSKPSPSPCLVAMTQFMESADPRRLEIERLADDPSVPCFVISKYKTLAEVKNRDQQLEARDWRDLVLRAIVYRREHLILKKLKQDASLRASVEKLGPFRDVFKQAHNLRNSSVVILVSEPVGLQATIAEAFGRRVERASIHDTIVGLSVERIGLALFGGWLDLQKLTSDDARLLLHANELVRDVVLSSEGTLGQRILLLRQRIITTSDDPRETGKPFRGLLILCVSQEFHKEMLALTGQPAHIYKAFPRIALPPYREVRRAIGPLIDLKLGMRGLGVDDLDRAVMAAYNWDLGFRGVTDRTGFAALEDCIDWASENADRNIVARGVIANELTQTDDGRKSVYSGLGRDTLLLYVFDRLIRVYKIDATLGAAAFLYYRTLCTLSGNNAEKQAVLESFWKENGIFEGLKVRGDKETKMKIGGSAGTWPVSLADDDLYRAKQANGGEREPTTASKMWDLLKNDFPRLLKDKEPHGSTPIEKRIIEQAKPLKHPGSGSGRKQLRVLDRSYLSLD